MVAVVMAVDVVVAIEACVHTAVGSVVATTVGGL